jgi:hypothetical protein
MYMNIRHVTDSCSGETCLSSLEFKLGNEPSISEIFNSLEVDDILRMNASTFDLADMGV